MSPGLYDWLVSKQDESLSTMFDNVQAGLVPGSYVGMGNIGTGCFTRGTGVSMGVHHLVPIPACFPDFTSFLHSCTAFLPTKRINKYKRGKYASLHVCLCMGFVGRCVNILSFAASTELWSMLIFVEPYDSIPVREEVMH